MILTWLAVLPLLFLHGLLLVAFAFWARGRGRYTLAWMAGVGGTLAALGLGALQLWALLSYRERMEAGQPWVAAGVPQAAAWWQVLGYAAVGGALGAVIGALVYGIGRALHQATPQR